MTWYPSSEGRYGINGAKGDRGEALVQHYWLANDISFIHLTEKSSQVNLKIDCLINDIPVDVKTNVNNGSLIVELYSRKKRAGWLFTTTAKQIYGVDIDTGAIYRYNVDDMVAYVIQNKHLARKVKKGDVLMWVSVDKNFIERLR